MTPAEQRVVEELDRAQGNVALVARLLGSSDSYIHRVKKALWQPKDPASTELTPAANEAKQLALLQEVIPPNIKDVMNLRDDTIRLLKQRVTEGMMTDDDATKLLKAIMAYERTLRQSLLPAVNVFNDNRQQNVTFAGLVDDLQKVHPDVLRALTAGQTEVIDILASEVE